MIFIVSTPLKNKHATYPWVICCTAKDGYFQSMFIILLWSKIAWVDCNCSTVKPKRRSQTMMWWSCIWCGDTHHSLHAQIIIIINHHRKCANRPAPSLGHVRVWKMSKERSLATRFAEWVRTLVDSHTCIPASALDGSLQGRRPTVRRLNDALHFVTIQIQLRNHCFLRCRTYHLFSTQFLLKGNYSCTAIAFCPYCNTSIHMLYTN